jgi:hypothetical protein
MVNEKKTHAMSKEQTVYQIKVQGQLDERWSDWFDGLAVTIESENPPVTTLTGPADQSALRGMLNRIWDLNLILISVVPKNTTPNRVVSVEQT